MRANRRTDTKPELALRRALHRLGYRYRKDYRLDLDGGRRVRPDIAFTARKVAIFVDGCFWHACPEHGSKPRANEWYWGPKLVRNVERDRANDTALVLAGWSVVRLWEHVPLEEAVAAVVTALGAIGQAVPPDDLSGLRARTVADSCAPCASSCPRLCPLWRRPCRPVTSGPARCPGSRSRLRCGRPTPAGTLRNWSTPR